MSTVYFALFLVCLAFQVQAQTTTHSFRGGAVNVTVTDVNGRKSHPVKPHPPPASPKPSPPPSPKPVASPALSYEDYSTTETRLRTFILKGDVAGAAEELRSMQVFGQGRGLTYPDELAPLVEPSDDRNRDPDVVAFKALAKVALNTCDAERLATVVMMSLTPPCICPIYGSEEEDNLRESLIADFEDQKAMLEVLTTDYNEAAAHSERKLLQVGKSPVNSFVCARCVPRRQCRKFHWC